MPYIIWDLVEIDWDIMECLWNQDYCYATEQRVYDNLHPYLLRNDVIPEAIGIDSYIAPIESFAYNKSGKIIEVAVPKISLPSEDDYISGYMYRYFCVQANNRFDKIKEVNEDEYTSILKNFFYKPYELRWKISGKQNDVKSENTNALKNAENEFPGISNIIKNTLEYWSNKYTVADSVSNTVPDSTINTSLKNTQWNVLPKISTDDVKISANDAIIKFSTFTIAYPEYVVPTDDDYANGYMIRYLCKLANNSQDRIKEISKDQYDSILKNFLYATITITWKLTGNQNTVKLKNKNAIQNAENQMIGVYDLFINNLLEYWKNLVSVDTNIDATSKAQNQNQENTNAVANATLKNIDSVGISVGDLNSVIHARFHIAQPARPLPNDSNYSDGYMVRYFCKQSNREAAKVDEISIDESSTLQNNFLYKTYQLQWKISGNKADVITENTNAINVANAEFSGIKNILKNPMEYWTDTYLIPASVPATVTSETIDRSIINTLKTEPELYIFRQVQLIDEALLTEDDLVLLTEDNSQLFTNTTNPNEASSYILRKK